MAKLKIKSQEAVERHTPTLEAIGAMQRAVMQIVRKKQSEWIDGQENKPSIGEDPKLKEDKSFLRGGEG